MVAFAVTRIFSVDSCLKQHSRHEETRANPDVESRFQQNNWVEYTIRVVAGTNHVEPGTIL